jgi:hypothetical protein
VPGLLEQFRFELQTVAEQDQDERYHREELDES